MPALYRSLKRVRCIVVAKYAVSPGEGMVEQAP